MGISGSMRDKGLLLEAVDLCPLAADAYLQILASNGLRASAIARAVDVPRPKIYEILAYLVHRGLVVEVKQGVARFHAVSPDLAMERFCADTRRTWEDRDRRMLFLQDQLEAVYEDSVAEPRRYDIVRIWSGQAVSTRRDALMAGTTDEYHGVFTMPHPEDHNLEDRLQAMRRMGRRDIRIRLLAHPEILALPPIQAYTPRPSLPAEIRTLTDPTPRFELFDRSIALAADPTVPREEYDELRFQEFHQPVIVKQFLRRFEQLWERAAEA